MQVIPCSASSRTLNRQFAVSEREFARLFQFGMRLGMRSYTLGGAWWQGDCGPYWGHNAIHKRLKPFVMPAGATRGSPFGGHVPQPRRKSKLH